MRYVPPDVRPCTVEDLQSWPLLGRVGYCVAGEDVDSRYVLLIGSFPGDFTLWSQWEPAGRQGQPKHPADEIDVDGSTLISVLSSNVILWCPPELDEAVERRILNLRRSYRWSHLRRGRWREIAALYRRGRPSVEQEERARAWPILV